IGSSTNSTGAEAPFVEADSTMAGLGGSDSTADSSETGCIPSGTSIGAGSLTDSIDARSSKEAASPNVLLGGGGSNVGGSYGTGAPTASYGASGSNVWGESNTAVSATKGVASPTDSTAPEAAPAAA